MKKSTFILLTVGIALLSAAGALFQITFAKQSLYDRVEENELL